MTLHQYEIICKAYRIGADLRYFTEYLKAISSKEKRLCMLAAMQFSRYKEKDITKQQYNDKIKTLDKKREMMKVEGRRVYTEILKKQVEFDEFDIKNELL